MSLESPPQPQTQHQPECQRLYSSCDVTSAARLLRKARHALQHKTSRLPALTGPEPWPTHAPSTAPPPLCAAHHHCTRCLATCLPFTFPTACLPCRMCLTNVQPPPFQCFPQPQDKTDIHPGPQGSHGAAIAWLLHSAPSQVHWIWWLGWGHCTLTPPALSVKTLQLPGLRSLQDPPYTLPGQAAGLGRSSLPQGQVERLRLMGEITRRANGQPDPRTMKS